MALLLGIDTGGTYTDAVLFEETTGVIATSKSLTTRSDFSVGISRAIDAVISNAENIDTKINPSDIALVSLSTTLATNALVEGQGGRVCLVLIGFDEKALIRSGLGAALKNDPVIYLPGGHNGYGKPATDFDQQLLRSELSKLAKNTSHHIAGFAVAGLFGVRNPEHELLARDIILEDSSHSVTCSHELSSKLDGPKRALTCVLNSRLINLIHHLITSTEELLKTRGIEAPLMVVQGDGALISADIAKIKPIETILSGPAASLVGAAYLTGAENALVSDIGGTTTDIASLHDGQPRLDPNGATVGGWQTMVEAVAIHTVGLGGDSEVHLVLEGLTEKLKLGPRRHIPISLLATDHPHLVHDTLDRQLNQTQSTEYDGRFAIAVGRQSGHISALPENEMTLLTTLLDKGPAALDQLLTNRRQRHSLDHLITCGLVMISSLTPSDASHILGNQDNWDREAADKAAIIFARKKNNRSLPIAQTTTELAEWIIRALVTTSAETLFDVSLWQDGFSPRTVHKQLLAASNDDQTGKLVSFQAALSVPLIGLGASAPTYYPEVAQMLKTEALIPEHAGVANAIGAVVGNVRVAVNATISAPDSHLYRVHANGEPHDFTDYDKAIEFAETAITGEARRQAEEAGASEVKIKLSRQEKKAVVEGQEIFFESLLTATASGRPRITG